MQEPMRPIDFDFSRLLSSSMRNVVRMKEEAAEWRLFVRLGWEGRCRVESIRFGPGIAGGRYELGRHRRVAL